MNTIKPTLKYKLIAASLMGFIALIAITPLCGFLFQCGCDWPWLGLDAGCNYHDLHAKHKCPWCASLGTGVLSTVAATLLSVLTVMIAPVPRFLRFVNEWVLRISFGSAIFAGTALVMAAIAAVRQDYPLGVGRLLINATI
ncbi:hypothetical protein [Methylotuvimicrobium alcaliphilum]|uniref:hypothetical protein n=1 Tax=Methylotuvimicrobium alcaliphilum TaxID=271065 RepID=UPI000317A982|nr:hypothetical protein [Methylotuvimicrobium alcaliphilum]